MGSPGLVCLGGHSRPVCVGNGEPSRDRPTQCSCAATQEPTLWVVGGWVRGELCLPEECNEWKREEWVGERQVSKA